MAGIDPTPSLPATLRTKNVAGKGRKHPPATLWRGFVAGKAKRGWEERRTEERNEEGGRQYPSGGLSTPGQGQGDGARRRQVVADHAGNGGRGRSGGDARSQPGMTERSPPEG